MKNTIVLITLMSLSCSIAAQKKNFSYHFYGFVRGDLFYNTRANQAPVDGNFYLYPLDNWTTISTAVETTLMPRQMEASTHLLPVWELT